MATENILGMGEFNTNWIIDDSNAFQAKALIEDPSTPFAGGYITEEEEQPSMLSALGEVCQGEWNGEIIPPRNWEDLIRFHEENQSSPDHHRLLMRSPILNQRSLPYCWIFGLAGAMQNAIAQTGAPVPHLSPAYPGALGKGWRKRGGLAGEAIRYTRRFGMPTTKLYPEAGFDRQLAAEQRVKDNAKLLDDLVFYKLPTERGRVPLEVMASVLLDPENPMPITTGFSWWGHLVFASKFVKGRDWGTKNPNSWGQRWGQDGCSVILRPKCQPFEGIAVGTVKTTPASYSLAV